MDVTIRQKDSEIERMQTILYVLAEIIRVLAIYLLPFMPDAMHKILSLLAVSEEKRHFSHVTAKSQLQSGTPLKTPEIIFPRY